MGYYAFHKLTCDSEIYDQVEEAINEVVGCGQILENHVKWYCCRIDMKKVSKRFPGKLLQIDGEGEESGDIWRAYYLDGKEHYARAKITFEEFNPEKLI